MQGTQDTQDMQDTQDIALHAPCDVKTLVTFARVVWYEVIDKQHVRPPVTGVCVGGEGR